MRIIFDGEFNGLTPTKMWCAATKDVDTGEVCVFRYDQPAFAYLLKEHLRKADAIIGHKILTYDRKWVNHLLGFGEVIHADKCIDTLILSRLIDAGRVGGHSVEALGKALGLSTSKVKVGNDDWDNPEHIDLYVERVKADVEIQYHIFRDLERFTVEEDWKKAVWCEHQVDLICEDMHENGFEFNKEEAEELLAEITKEMRELEARIIPAIPPKCVPEKEPNILKRKKDGEPSVHTERWIGSSYQHIEPDFRDGCEYHRFQYRDFNPGSATDRVEYLNACGWKPYEKTKGHVKQERKVNRMNYKLRYVRKKDRPEFMEELENERAKLEKYKVYGWKVSEGNLDTLPVDAPEAASLLAAWLALDGRRGDLVEWLEAYVPHTGRVHGSFNGIGAWTHRLSHYAPNQGNIFSSFEHGDIRGDSPSLVEAVKLKYNNRLRGCWCAADGAYLVGTDASSIQLRILAEYIGDEDYANAVVRGRQEDGTDVHSLNAKFLGPVCAGRKPAKTFIYAWVLGAGDEEVSRILQCSRAQARTAVDSFVSSLPGLESLKHDRVVEDASRGYFVGLDGRKVIVSSQHLVLAGYLQNGEKCIMAHANIKWRSELAGDGVKFKQVDWVHDEWQTESYSPEDAEQVGLRQREAITWVGTDLGMVVPLAGETKIGRNWYATH